MNEFHKLLKETEEKYDNTETVEAPSGEWSAHNIDYIEMEAKWFGMEELAIAVGECSQCKHYDKAPPWQCRVKPMNSISRSHEFYCADFHRVADTEKE